MHLLFHRPHLKKAKLILVALRHGPYAHTWANVMQAKFIPAQKANTGAQRTVRRVQQQDKVPYRYLYCQPNKQVITWKQDFEQFHAQSTLRTPSGSPIRSSHMTQSNWLFNGFFREGLCSCINLTKILSKISTIPKRCGIFLEQLKFSVVFCSFHQKNLKYISLEAF